MLPKQDVDGLQVASKGLSVTWMMCWCGVGHKRSMLLHSVLGRMQKAGITLNVDKCDLSRHEMRALDHIISGNGISPDPKTTAALKEME